MIVPRETGKVAVTAMGAAGAMFELLWSMLRVLGAAVLLGLAASNASYGATRPDSSNQGE